MGYYNKDYATNINPYYYNGLQNTYTSNYIYFKYSYSSEVSKWVKSSTS